MIQSAHDRTAAARRAQMEAALADYPHLSEDRLTALVFWFRTEASSADRASIAANPSIARSYRRFRSEHLEDVSGGELATGLALIAAVGAGVGLMA